MAIFDLQQRARELGRIRIGQTVETKNGKTRPAKLDRFRLTSASRPLLEQVAALYGGTVADWQPQGGGPAAFEVVTNSTRLPVMVPPQPLSQFYELWSGGGCRRRCDSRIEMISGDPCVCGPDPKERVCSPTTRLNVVLRDVPGVGVWRLESHGYNAAVELPQAAMFLAQAAQAGSYINGFLALEARRTKREVDGKIETRDFMVPTIEIDLTPAELMAGKATVTAPEVTGNTAAGEIETGDTRAIEASPPAPDYAAEAAIAESLQEIRDIWGRADEAGHLTDDLKAVLTPIGNRLAAAEQQRATTKPDDGAQQPREAVAGSASTATAAPSSTPPADRDAPPEVVDAEIVDDGDEDAIWNQILKVAGGQGMSLADIEDDFARKSGGVTAATAGAAEMQAYLDQLKAAA